MRLTKGQLFTLGQMRVDPVAYSEDALRAFFAYTDRGVKPTPVEYEHPNGGRVYLKTPIGFTDLMQRFEWMNPHTIHDLERRWWGRDFKSGFLFMSDFLDEPRDMFIEALQIYEKAHGYILYHAYRQMIQRIVDILEWRSNGR